MKTPYTIDGQYVRKNGSIEAICPIDDESKLHAIWVMEGRNPEHFYENVDGVVYLNIKGERDDLQHHQ